jgi:hypothetical protein
MLYIQDHLHDRGFLPSQEREKGKAKGGKRKE